MRRRSFLALLSTALIAKGRHLPANRNVKWAVSANLWNHFPPVAFTEILDVMRDTGFIGIRMTQFPGILQKYRMSITQLEAELSKRDLHIATISFNGPSHDPQQQTKVLDNARKAMDFLAIFGANRLVVFSPSRRSPEARTDAAFKTMCQTFNRIGELAGEKGFRAGLHNHLGQMCEKPEEIDRCMRLTDPKLFGLSPDTAHLFLGGSNVVEMFQKYKNRLVMMDYKDAKWTTPPAGFTDSNGKVVDPETAKFLSSIYDLGDGEIDFPGCHRVLKEIGYQGWNCVDLDTARKGPRISYERCGNYIVNTLEPIYS
ncbi:MAG TPA: TIM barrel protein [Bryobacteraceae bacterium]|jgi:inosose dehydratase|nr:TIM barrel protein [Bryobacteraceae bacterium]